MKKLLHVAMNTLLLLAKTRMTIFWLIILPLALTTLVCLVFGGIGEGQAVGIDLPVVDQDEGEMAVLVADILSQAANLNVETIYDEETARQLVADGERAGAVIIPPDFSTAIGTGAATNLELIVPVGGQTTPLLEGMMRGIANNFSNVQATVLIVVSEVQRVAQGSSQDWGEIATRAASMAVEQLREPSVTVHITAVGNPQVTFNSFEQWIPGYAVMFAMFAVLSSAGSVLEEKEMGTFKRLVLAPIPKWALLGGKLLAQFLLSVGQMFMMFAFGALVFDLSLGDSFVGLLLITLATGWAVTSLGILLVAVARTRAQLQPITMLVALGSSALGGAWFPFFLMPKTIQNVSRITLVSWAMEGYNRLIILGGNLADVWINIGALLLYGAICFVIGVRLFKFKADNAG